ncbi:Chemotactic signal transduction system substrate-binding protein BasB [ANME-1 cluster archaeon GoMg3.2]|nr:Chemotactic signal transduction system substrate-binding protein BasB [ANME-1 cluster archaeon GoMg3.2]
MNTKGLTEGLVIATLVLAAVLSVGAVGAEDVTIGVLYPFSGDLGIYGEPETDAMKMAVGEVNENGGVLGGRLKLIIMDTETSEVVALAEAQKLLDLYNVSIIIGTAGSETCKAIIGYTTSNGVLLISPAATGVEFTTYPDNDLFFRTCPSDELQGIAMARLAIQQGYKTASTLVVWNPYGIGFEKAFTKRFETLGGKVLESVRYDPDRTTFNSEVEKVAAVNPDFVMLCAYPETGSVILKTAYKKGYMDNIAWLLSEGLISDELADMVGKDEAGNYIIAGLKGTTPDPRVMGPAYDTFEQNYIAEFGKKPISYCANSYDAVAVVALAIEKAGDSSGTAIRDSLRDVANPPGDKEVSDIGEALDTIREGFYSINYQGASGEITFDEHGDVMGSYCEWTIADNGRVVYGTPIELKGPIVPSTPSPKPTVVETPEPTVAETPEPTVAETPEPTVAETPTPTVAETPTPTPPGFEVVFAIASIFAVVFLVRIRKRA